jgi:hypothetical protein
VTNTTGIDDRTEVAMDAREQPLTPEALARPGSPEPAGQQPALEPATKPAPPVEPSSPREAPDVGEANAPLFDAAATDELRSRWSDVQGSFVDEPRSAVEQADGLVGDVMKRLADGFASERQSLESQWSRGDDVSTEELRLALQRYRSFFDRLLSL